MNSDGEKQCVIEDLFLAEMTLTGASIDRNPARMAAVVRLKGLEMAALLEDLADVLECGPGDVLTAARDLKEALRRKAIIAEGAIAYANQCREERDKALGRVTGRCGWCNRDGVEIDARGCFRPHPAEGQDVCDGSGLTLAEQQDEANRCGVCGCKREVFHLGRCQNGENPERHFEARMPAAWEVDAWSGELEGGATRKWQWWSEAFIISSDRIIMHDRESLADCLDECWSMGDRIRPVLVHPDGTIEPRPWPLKKGGTT